jgi:hypothetical protein
MWFALAYLVFFTLDILFESQFTVFGMQPYHTLITALSLYTLIMLRHVGGWCRSSVQILAVRLWQVFFVILLMHEFTNITYPFWSGSLPIEVYSGLLAYYNHILFYWATVLLIVTWATLKPIHPLYPVFLFSAGGALFHFAVQCIITTFPVFLMRYEGILGLPMLFGWLMISIRIIKIKYDHEYWDWAID